MYVVCTNGCCCFWSSRFFSFTFIFILRYHFYSASFFFLHSFLSLRVAANLFRHTCDIRLICVPLASESVYEYSAPAVPITVHLSVGQTIDDWLVNNLGSERKQRERYGRLVVGLNHNSINLSGG